MAPGDHYRIAGEALPRDLVDAYLSLRHGSGPRRVRLHRLILRHAGARRGDAWWRAFEAWAEEEVQKPHWVRYHERRDAYRQSHPHKCRRCGRRFSVREAFMAHLEGAC